VAAGPSDGLEADLPPKSPSRTAAIKQACNETVMTLAYVNSDGTTLRLSIPFGAESWQTYENAVGIRTHNTSNIAELYGIRGLE
jgi:hypothetical protein